MRFEIFQGKNGQYYWRLKSRNNQIVAQSEGYTRRNGAERAAAKIAADLYGRLATVKVIE